MTAELDSAPGLTPVAIADAAGSKALDGPPCKPPTLERVKYYLSEPRFRIRLHDTLVNTVRQLRGTLDGPEFSTGSMSHTLENDQILARIARYEDLCRPLSEAMAAVAYWGDASQARLLARCLTHLGDATEGHHGFEILVNLRRYPALILTYASGTAALAAGRYDTLASLLTSTRVMRRDEPKPLVVALARHTVIDGEVLKLLPSLNKKPTPFSTHLYDWLRETLGIYALGEMEYRRAFDLFEYLYALVYVDLIQKEPSLGRGWGPLGCFLWRRAVLAEVEAEITQFGDDWPPLKAGLFDGSLERLKEVKAQFDRSIRAS